MRKPQQSFGVREGSVTPSKYLLSDSLRNHPLSDEFVVPKIETTKDAVNLLVARQIHALGESILSTLSFRILQRKFKPLLEEHGPDVVARAIVYAVRVSDHPCSTKFVKECILWLQEHHSQLLKTSEKNTMQNKS